MPNPYSLDTSVDEPSYIFCQHPDQLEQSLIAFNQEPDLHRAALGNAPRYFVHQIRNGHHYFGLSKFCAFHDITLGTYISRFRYVTSGGTTQRHIKWLMQQEWIPYPIADDNIQRSFRLWLQEHIPNYRLENASFISLTPITTPPQTRTTRSLTPEQLRQKLERQAQIGAAGEIIALQFERNRLAGVKNAVIDAVCQRNVAAGFDILSQTKDELRCIEVKSSTSVGESFFLSRREYQVLKDLEDKAYLYFVRVDDVSHSIGEVVSVIQNPISRFTDSLLIPVIYEVISTDFS